MKKRLLYVEPRSEEWSALCAELICESPTEGGLEGISEEDWVV